MTKKEFEEDKKLSIAGKQEYYGGNKVKTDNSFHKVWEVLLPFLIYYIVYNILYILMAALLNVMRNQIEEGGDYLMQHAATVTGLVNELCMIGAVLPLWRMGRLELGNCTIPVLGGKQKWVWCAVLALGASLGLNSLFAISGFATHSATYQDVAQNQYGVTYGIGLILYGIISPLVEEVVFRGIIYNRMRRFYPVTGAILMSGVLFGAYHGNLVQGVYGTCMGILLAYVYERTGHFFIPVGFHVIANVAVYTISHVPAWQDWMLQVWSCVLLLVLAGVSLFAIERGKEAR